MTTKLRSGSPVPEITVPRAGGGELRIGGARECWQLLIVYRGRHCPPSKRFLGRLNDMVDDFAARDTEIIAVSADAGDQAEADLQEFGWRFPLGYDLGVDSMRALGTYISAPRPQETDRPFSEPGLFVITPTGHAQIIDISNAPFSMPDLDNLLTGLIFIQNRGYPPRGTLN